MERGLVDLSTNPFCVIERKEIGRTTMQDGLKILQLSGNLCTGDIKKNYTVINTARLATTPETESESLQRKVAHT
jgi:hypothetical protein